jgi:mono/diheme cytochrome c family protein
MNKAALAVVLCLLLLALAAIGQQRASVPPSSPSAASSAAPASDHQALLNDYCVSCHSEALNTAGLVLENRDLANVPRDAQTWEKVIRKLRTGAMPPQGMPRPDEASADRLASWLEATLDRTAAADPNPGRTLVHRLNRSEYANAMRDLLALDVDVSSLLPPDDSAEGFDNIAQALTLSPLLLERYLSASAKIASFAVGNPDIAPIFTTYRPRPDLSQDSHVEGAPIGTVGGLVVTHNFPLDGEYSFEPKLYRGILAMVKGLEDPSSLEVAIDGERVKLAHFGGHDDNVKSHENATATADEVDARLAFRIPVTAGPHTVAVAFLRKPLVQSAELWQQFRRTAIDSNEDKGSPHLHKVDVVGPFNATGPGDTPSRRRVFLCRPAPGEDELPCAKEILTNLARRAYRRPVTDQDMEDLITFYQRGRNKGAFDQGIEMAIRRIISGPEFVFRTETDPEVAAPNSPYEISDLELASRLSFFLWSTIPDDQLYEAALQGTLKDPRVLEQQVRRMLADPKAEALVANFAGQWLSLRNLAGVVPDPEVFPDFDDNLRRAFVRETELLFATVMREDRNVADLLTADFTFVNERLARHYGIPNVYGDRFRRVAVAEDARKGLLGHGSILTLTSVAIRTSPVVRGKWVLTNILGTPPPPPPPDVPALEENKSAKNLTMRERMAAHRANPACASCHKLMDPIGFSLENFDAVGRWRDNEGGARIDAADTAYDGAKIEGVVGLRHFLLSREQVFVQTVTERLLTYALGRAVDYYDMPAVRRILRDSSASGDRFSSLVTGIVKSEPFRMRMKLVQPNIGAYAAAAGAPLVP